MIDIKLRSEGNKSAFHIEDKDATFKEVGLMVAELERMKLFLLTEFEFEAEYESENETP